ncbi:hypothetical protein ACHAWF_016486, partial [Thalassiosira exigua]
MSAPSDVEYLKDDGQGVYVKDGSPVVYFYGGGGHHQSKKGSKKGRDPCGGYGSAEGFATPYGDDDDDDDDSSGPSGKKG